MTPTQSELVARYRAEKLAFFPLPLKSKIPNFKWQTYQKRLPTDAEISAWFNGVEPTNIAVICGSVSGGLVILDFDDMDFYYEFDGKYRDSHGIGIEEFTRVTRGKRGAHVWVMVHQPVKATKTLKCEIRSDGNIQVVPPSVHPDGPTYQFLSDIPIAKIESLLDIGIDLNQAPPEGSTPSGNQPGWVAELLKGVGEGQRNESAVKLAGYFRHRLPVDVTEHLMTEWNDKNAPPLPHDELMSTIQSVYRYPKKEMWGEGEGGTIGGIGVEGLPVINNNNSILNRGDILSGGGSVTKAQPNRNEAQRTVTPITNVTNVTLDSLKAYVSESDGQWIDYRDLDNDLGIRFPEQKAIRRVGISRLIEQKIIEKHPTINTKVRFLNNAMEDMVLDFNKEADYIHLGLPFDIEKKVDIYPHSLSIVAGSKDAGKTAFCLNLARTNCTVGKVHYFNSEMGDIELMNRLRNFDDYKLWVPKIHWVERAGGFEDVIFPNDINIVDFFEINDNFYLIGAFLAAIYKKLDKGVAFVALQKNPNSRYGRGDTFSLEKARLYVTLNHISGVNTATIESGKMWHNSMDNPRGQFVNYKIVKGCRFTDVSEWQQAKQDK